MRSAWEEGVWELQERMGRAAGRFPSGKCQLHKPVERCFGESFLKRLLSPGDRLVWPDPDRAAEGPLRGKSLFGELFPLTSHLDVKRRNTRCS